MEDFTDMDQGLGKHETKIDKVPGLLLNNYESYFEQHFDNSILKDTLQWKILQTWIKTWVNMKRK